MARLPRVDIPGLPQHVVVRGNNRLSFLDGDCERFVFLKQLADAANTWGCDIHAYVLMSNHVHLLVTAHEFGGLSALMHSVGRRFSRFFNVRRKRTGTLFEGRFRSSVVDTDRYLLTCMRYIEANPVRAGMVRHPGEWPWSSYAINAAGLPTAPLTGHSVYLGLGRDPAMRGTVYRSLFEQEIRCEDLEAIRSSIQMNRAFGSEEFIDALEARLNRPVAVTTHGGSRKTLVTG